MCDYLGEFILVYLNDILVFSEREAEHMKDIKTVCRRLKEPYLFASRKKSEFITGALCRKTEPQIATALKTESRGKDQNKDNSK